MAVLIGVRSIQPFKALVIMTDSQCVVHWIKSKKTLPTFVKNREEETHSHSYAQVTHSRTGCRISHGYNLASFVAIRIGP